MAEKEAEISEGKLRDALKQLEADEKEIAARKTSIAAYLNTRASNRELEKQKAALQKELGEVINTMDQARAKHVEDWNKREAEYKQRSADLEAVHDKAREAEQKELAGLKAAIAKAKKQAADTEKEASEKIAESTKKMTQVLAENHKLIEGLDKEIQEKRDKIAVLEEEFRSLAQKHGLGAAVSN